MSNRAKILYVEDDDTLRFITQENLERAGFKIIACADGLEGYAAYQQYKPELCLLDVMLPEVDGFTLAKKIRQDNPDIPILFLTAKTLQEDRIEGLVLGGDDYIVKPFSIEELILRIKVFLRRSKTAKTREQFNSISLGNYKLDTFNLTLSTNSQVIKVTQRESDLLLLFIQNKNELITRERILETIWGENDYFHGRSLDVFISKLRKYLKSDPNLKIENRHGIGFRLVEVLT